MDDDLTKDEVDRASARSAGRVMANTAPKARMGRREENNAGD